MNEERPGDAQMNAAALYREDIFTDQRVFKFGYLTFFLEYFQPAILQCHSGAVIAPVLQPLQTFDDNWVSFLRSGISNNSTHDRCF